jgi:hypothetical protein
MTVVPNGQDDSIDEDCLSSLDEGCGCLGEGERSMMRGYKRTKEHQNSV